MGAASYLLQWVSFVACCVVGQECCDCPKVTSSQRSVSGPQHSLSQKANGLCQGHNRIGSGALSLCVFGARSASSCAGTLSTVRNGATDVVSH